MKDLIIIIEIPTFFSFVVTVAVVLGDDVAGMRRCRRLLLVLLFTLLRDGDDDGDGDVLRFSFRLFEASVVSDSLAFAIATTGGVTASIVVVVVEEEVVVVVVVVVTEGLLGVAEAEMSHQSLPSAATAADPNSQIPKLIRD